MAQAQELITLGDLLATDHETLLADFIAHLQSVYGEDYVVNEGNLEVVIGSAKAVVDAETRAVMANLSTEVYRDMGTRLFGIVADEATPASVGSTWTMVNNAGYTIEAGTEVTIAKTGSEAETFYVVADVVVAPGATVTATGEVELEAVNAGAAASGLSGEVRLVSALSYVAEPITLVGSTSGGADAETLDDYLVKLTRRLQLREGGVVLPDDFAALALDVDGVGRSTAIDLLIPGTNEKQTVAVVGTGGSFTLTYSGQTTAAIASNATNATVLARLEALSNIAVGDVVVTGGPFPGTMTVEFVGALAATNVGQMTSTSSLTGPGAGVTHATTVPGVANQTGQEKAVTVVVADEDGLALTSSVRDEVDALLQALREVNFLVNVISPTYVDFDVATTVRALAEWDTADVDTRVGTAITDYLSSGGWGRTQPELDDWVNDTVVRYLELAQVINSVDGVDYIESLSFGVHGGTQGTTNVTMAGVAPLPRMFAGQPAVTVNAAA